MRYNLVAKREAPEPPYECEMVDVDVEAIPFMLSSLWLRAQKYWWITDDDQKYGRWLMNKEGAALLMPCSRAITNLLEAQYNLLDATIRGEMRDVTGAGTDADPFIYDPIIPQTVDPLVYLTPGLQFNSEKSLRGVENIADGRTSSNFSDERNFRAILEEIRDALTAESNEETVDLLQKIFLALGGVL